MRLGSREGNEFDRNYVPVLQSFMRNARKFLKLSFYDELSISPKNYHLPTNKEKPGEKLIFEEFQRIYPCMILNDNFNDTKMNNIGSLFSDHKQSQMKAFKNVDCFIS